jgi:FMN phosphatase YigB (HAD superfamily)
MIKAILFDAFGTLAEIAERRRPYAKLLSLADAKTRPTHADYAAIVMGRDWAIQETADWLGVTQTQAQEAGVFEGLVTELMSMRLFPEAAETLAQLRANGFTLGICSNLAQPYSAPLRALLPFEMDAYVWSFELDYQA